MAVEVLDSIENAVYEADPVEHSGRPSLLCLSCDGTGESSTPEDGWGPDYCLICKGTGVNPFARQVAPNTCDMQRRRLIAAQSEDASDRADMDAQIEREWAMYEHWRESGELDRQAESEAF